MCSNKICTYSDCHIQHDTGGNRRILCVLLNYLRGTPCLRGYFGLSHNVILAAIIGYYMNF